MVLSEMRRITEEANPATDRMDSLGADEILAKFRSCDDEMFGPAAAGSDKKLFDRENLLQLEKVKEKIRDFHAAGNSRKSAIILTGSGTSGRIAYLIAKKWNDVMDCDVTYLIAGGSRSLVTSQEAPEDDFDRGAADLMKVSENYENILLIAISCAMTAPYVIGQLRFATSASITSGRFASCLVGFNTTGYFMNAMKDQPTIVDSVSNGSLILINPIVGPEAITGSSRMKGGSMTKILLETLFASALFGGGEPRVVEEMLKAHQQAISNFYETCGTFLGRLMRSGGDSLLGGSEIVYFGVGNPALLGVIDAAECIPTFGAGLEDVRGFILGGFDQKQMLGEMDMGEGEFLRRIKDKKNLTIFISLPASTVFPGFWGKFGKVFGANSESGNKIFWMAPQRPEMIPDYVAECCHLRIENFQNNFPAQLVPHLGTSLVEICYKLAFNSVSTGAFILNGKVYHNMMVDMKLSNEKLFHRAINIVQKFCENSTKEAIKEVLLKIIYKTEDLSEKIVATSVHDHITVAESQEKIIPCAIVMLKAQCSRTEAVDHLNKFHKIRDAVDNI